MSARHVSSSLFWCAVVVKRAAARMAEARLGVQGFPVFAPKTTQLRRSFGRITKEQRLLFPGYIFAAVDLENPKWRAIFHTPGVSRIIMGSANAPAFVPPSFMEDLMARCDESGNLVPADPFKSGDRVCVTSGPFAGIVTTIEKVDEEKRVWILLDILGGGRAVTVDPKALIAG